PFRRGLGLRALALQRAHPAPRQLRAGGGVRELADSDRIRRFTKALGGAARLPGTCYLAGGASAVLLGWRATTVAVDIALEPEQIRRAYAAIEPDLWRFPAIDPRAFRARVERVSS